MIDYACDNLHLMQPYDRDIEGGTLTHLVADFLPLFTDAGKDILILIIIIYLDDNNVYVKLALCVIYSI